MDAWDRPGPDEQRDSPIGVLSMLARVLVFWRASHDTAWDAAFELSRSTPQRDERTGD